MKKIMKVLFSSVLCSGFFLAASAALSSGTLIQGPSVGLTVSAPSNTISGESRFERNKRFLDQKLAALGLKRVPTSGGGDCGYHAALIPIQGQEVRGRVIHTVADLRQSLHDFLLGLCNNHEAAEASRNPDREMTLGTLLLYSGMEYTELKRGIDQGLFSTCASSMGGDNHYWFDAGYIPLLAALLERPVHLLEVGENRDGTPRIVHACYLGDGSVLEVQDDGSEKERLLQEAFGQNPPAAVCLIHNGADHWEGVAHF